MKKRPSAEEVRRLLDYDPLTGVFTWKRRDGVLPTWNIRYAHKEAGCHVGKYLEICINGVRHGASRIAWVWMTGAWPQKTIDHRDRNGINNRWENLRSATGVQQTGNQKLRVTNGSGLRGVRFHKRAQKWNARITINGEEVHLGLFRTKEDAYATYLAAARSHFGEYFHDPMA